jgi:hypothetical protein
MEARGRLLRLAIGGWAAQALFAAAELELFTLLDGGSLEAEEVSARLGTDADGTRSLLWALVAIGVLERDGTLFANGSAAREFLVPGKASSMNTWLSAVRRRDHALSKLPEILRTGDAQEHLGRPAADIREFVTALHEYALGPGSELAENLDLRGRGSLLDVGGGAGTYSILLAAANPSLRCTVVDLPDVVPIARELIERHGLEDRVTAEAGDYLHEGFRGTYDTALLSNVLHQEDWDSCVAILRRLHAALEPGGLLAVHGTFLDERGSESPWPALHNLVLLGQPGRVYSTEETLQMLAEAGFDGAEVDPMSPFSIGSVVTAVRR